MHLNELLLHRHLPARAAAFPVVALFALVLTACRPPASAPTTTVNVQGADFAFIADKASVPPGKVHFVFSNTSTTNQHELWVYPQDQPRLQAMVQAKESGEDVDEKDYLQNIAGDVEDVPVGQTQSFDATLQPGTYEFACFVTSTVGGQLRVHYALGMHGVLTVTGS